MYDERGGGDMLSNSLRRAEMDDVEFMMFGVERAEEGGCSAMRENGGIIHGRGCEYE